jgi:hypothetical protein
MKMLLQLLETKKRGRLERMIYAGELNATIGVHLMKGWREAVIPQLVKYRSTTLSELDELELTDEQIKTYADIERKLAVLRQ